MKRAFAVAAHPDDIEFCMAGTLLLLQQAGYEIHLMTIGNGSCGSMELSAAHTAELRQREQIAAADLVGAHYHPSLVNDLEIFYDRPTLVRLAAVMRDVAPEILLTHAPADYMEDHQNACRLALTAAFARGMPNFSTKPPRPPVEQPVTVYHAQPHGNRDPLGRLVRPDIFVDLGGVMKQKTAMLACHQSQVSWLDATQGMGSYLESMQSLAREVGGMSGRYEFAEGWRRHLHLGYCDAQADPLCRDLAEHVLVEPNTP